MPSHRAASCQVIVDCFRRTMGRVLVALLMMGAAPSFAQRPDVAGQGDRVTVSLPDGAGRIVVTGEVLDYTGRGLRLRAKSGGTPRDYPANQVLDVSTVQTPRHAEGMTHFHEGRLPEAKAAFEAALDDEPRAWVRREILAMLVRCALRQGDLSMAGARFQLLARSDPDTPHYRLAPLRWESTDAPADLKLAARIWKGQQGDAAKLLAASVLLLDQGDGRDAERALGDLSANVNESIRTLAAAQLWRKELSTKNIDREEVDRWHRKVEEMPEGLRGGPYYVVGTAHRIRREYDRAAACLMWLPVVYADAPLLAARAGVEAGDSLARIGQRDEARAIYREVAERFKGTPFAREAADALEALKDVDP